MAKASPVQSKAGQGPSRDSGTAGAGGARSRARSSKLQDDDRGKPKKGGSIGSAVAAVTRDKGSKGKKGLGKFIWWW